MKARAKAQAKAKAAVRTNALADRVPPDFRVAAESVMPAIFRPESIGQRLTS